MSIRRSVAGLVGWLVVCYGASYFGAQFTTDAWYRALDKPAWTPPDAVFGPVWTVLYGLMAVAAWLVWRRCGFDIAIVLFLVQLVLNAAWSWLFFGQHLTGVALLDLVVLIAVLTATVVSFWHRRRLAAGLLIPYLAWVCFATALNFEIWRLQG